MKLIEKIYPVEHKTDFKTQYIKYRAGRLKHQYWLWNRKSKDKKLVDEYDFLILQNCQPGKTAFFSSAGYYLNDIYGNIDSIEIYPVVKEFYPRAIVVTADDNLEEVIPYKFDNFAVVNNRSDHWVTTTGITERLSKYCQMLNPGARVFYSFRDTQIQYNRLIVDQEKYFLEWAQGLTSIGLTLVWQDIQFKKKEKDGSGIYDQSENPDTTNGNLKFWFVYKGDPWTITK